MPIVLATGAPTASGHAYDDVLGKQYEFPLQYRTLVTPGESFVYYRGRRGSEDGRPVYFGSGVIGAVRASSRTGQLIAEVHDVELFDEPVPAKALDDTYLETGSDRGTNWTSGVRRISDDALTRIVGSVKEPSPTTPPPRSHGPAFASPEHASALERYSVKVALGLLADEFGAAVREMPPGNPGFDILVERADADLHVEVKGTILPDPVFHLSEGQRQHAASRGADFRLIVVYGVSLAQGVHQVIALAGPLDSAKVDLQAEAWTGRVLL